jgi:hypothetical protein
MTVSAALTIRARPSRLVSAAVPDRHLSGIDPLRLVRTNGTRLA